MELKEPKYFKLQSTLDNIDLDLVLIEPENSNEIKAVVQMVHGMAEHKERYLDMMKYISSFGYVTIMHDNRGHGKSIKSPEDIGYMYAHRDLGLVEDCVDVNNWIRKNYKGFPVYLFGHSMGSLIVRTFCKRHDRIIDGLIVCGSPSYNPGAAFGKYLCSIMAFGGSDKPTKGWRKVVPFITKISTGGFNRNFMSEKSLNSWICSDANVVEAYDNDPLCGFEFTLNGYYSLFALMQKAYRKRGWSVNNPYLPIHFISGEKDPCMGSIKKFEATVDFIKGRGYELVSSKVYPQVRHEIHNDVSKEEVWKDIVKLLNSWIDRRGF